jgi:ABC-2 type transport system permease protein
MVETEDSCSQVICDLNAAWAIAKKDIRTYYLKPNIIVAGLLFPLFMFLAFAAGRTTVTGSLIPGLVAITILFSASTIEPVSIPIERRVGTFERLISAPVTFPAIVFGESLSGLIYSVGIALLPVVIGLLAFSTPILNPLILFVGMVLCAFCFSTMGTLVASYPTENVGEVMSILNVIRLPLVFISGVFIPLADLPGVARIITFGSPLTYGYDLISYGFHGTGYFPIFLDLAVLVGFCLLFQYTAAWLYRRFNE